MAILPATSNTYTATGISPCPAHGTYLCNCYAGSFQQVTCPTCRQYYYNGSIHMCPNTWHTHTTTTIPWATGTTIIGSTFSFSPLLKEIKEIITDSELTYEWIDTGYAMKIPAKFGDCFLKVGDKWSPLYPLIFSALENDDKAISFHIVVGIVDKVFEGDKVVLKSVTISKIDDNLTLLQLTERAREYLKKDEK